MEHNVFNYILEVIGHDNKTRRDQDGNYIPPVAFKETNYFNTLRDAVESLLLTDIRKFEEMSEEASKDKCCEYASITATSNNQPIVEIIRLSFRDTPDGSPPAGIYMNFVDSATKNFEQLSGYSFSRFEAYDPESPFLMLASYSYDRGFKISVDQALKDWVNSLEYYELAPQFYDKDWNYKVDIVQNSIAVQAFRETTSYHYPNLPETLHQLLHTDINQMNKHLTEGTGTENWISEARIVKRGGGKLAEFVAVKNDNTLEKVSEPGIHLKCYIPIKNLEKESGIDLSRLGNYDQDDNYLLVANYSRDYNSLLPHPGYLNLLKFTDKENRKQFDDQTPYILGITWEATQHPNEIKSDPQQQLQQIACSSLDQALSSMRELDERLFDTEQALRLHYPLYIKQADIKDARNNTIVVTKFQVRQKDDQRPAAMYMSVNEQHASEETLRLIRAFVIETTQARLQQFSTTGEKTSQQFSSQDEAAQLHRPQRTRIPPDNKGLRL